MNQMGQCSGVNCALESGGSLAEDECLRVTRGNPKKPSAQFSSVTQLGLSLCHPMDCSMSDFPVHHQLLELAQAHCPKQVWIEEEIPDLSIPPTCSTHSINPGISLAHANHLLVYLTHHPNQTKHFVQYWGLGVLSKLSRSSVGGLRERFNNFFYFKVAWLLLVNDIVLMVLDHL